MILKTNRLFLREMDDNDIDSLKAIVKLPDGNLCNDEYAKKWISWCKSSYKKDGFGHYAVINSKTNEMIGSAGISMQYIFDKWLPEIGYHIRKDYQRIGLGKEVAAALRDYFFINFSYDEVYCYMEMDNIASYKTAESIGMKYVGDYKDQYKVYKLTRIEWENINR